MTLTLRARLATISTVVFGLLLAALSVVSYEVLSRRLDADVTERLAELTDGLHGYLRFDADKASIAFDASDNDQAAFVHEATRYYQVYDAGTGRLLAESNGIAPLALHLTPGEVQSFRAEPQPFDIETEYGRLRLSNSVKTVGGRPGISAASGGVTGADGWRAGDAIAVTCLWRVPLALVVAVFAAWWLSGFALRPLSRVAAAARQIDVRSLERRLPVRGVGDELDRRGGRVQRDARTARARGG